MQVREIIATPMYRGENSGTDGDGAGKSRGIAAGSVVGSCVFGSGIACGLGSVKKGM